MGKYKDGNVRAEDAARELNMSVDSLRQCMLHGTIDIGIVKKGKVNNAYYIKRKPLDDLKRKWGL